MRCHIGSVCGHRARRGRAGSCSTERVTVLMGADCKHLNSFCRRKDGQPKRREAKRASNCGTSSIVSFLRFEITACVLLQDGRSDLGVHILKYVLKQNHRLELHKTMVSSNGQSCFCSYCGFLEGCASHSRRRKRHALACSLE